jgi:hypothetical protein
MKINLIVLSLLASNLVFANGLTIKSHTIKNISWSEYQSQIKHITTKNAMCKASADPASGQAGQNITATGEVSYVITNDSDNVGNYNFDEYMCILNFGCTHIQESGSVLPHTTGYNDAKIFTMQNIKKAGNYVDQASIVLDGSSTCMVQDSNTVTVS